MDRPRRLRGFDAYLTYLALIAFALIAVALFVSIILMIIGLILINSNETKNLAGSVYIYHPFPGIMVSKQLLSLSLSLGAFQGPGKVDVTVSDWQVWTVGHVA